MLHTIEEGWAVVRETARILAETPRLRRKKPQPTIDARASAETDPPARPESFHDEIVRHQKNGESLAEATRSAAIERPDLRADFVKKSNEKRELETEVEKATARRRRDLNR